MRDGNQSFVALLGWPALILRLRSRNTRFDSTVYAQSTTGVVPEVKAIERKAALDLWILKVRLESLAIDIAIESCVRVDRP